MTARSSLRSQLLLGSLLWTFGVLLFVSVLLIAFLARHPRPHAVVLGWVLTLPAAVTGAVGIGCMTAGALRIRRSLSAVDQLRERLADVRRGEGTALSGSYPSEVQPLVDDLNRLLAEREQRLDRAIARTGDLAHGLKTPLAVLSSDATRAIALGAPTLAESMHAQVQRMRRQIDYHLAHARAAAGASSAAAARTAVAPSVEGLFRTLERLHADRPMALEFSVAGNPQVRCRREDLEEMLGNLLDNACKWGRSRVHVEARAVETGVRITVDDDGPGVEPALVEAVLQRGVRADERVPGSGLGLAIVHDLADLYGGSIELARSPLGGLRATLLLPSTDAAGAPA